uniref:Uncharacterized protein n=1 Tax=Avena sativa TaxID=4498 RepID=A0ACD5YBT6_AVESA
MAEAAGAAVPEAPLLLGLPDEIVVWEILVRLPPNSLLRCRAVSRAWRRATSARDFLLAHHDRQPTLPLLFEDRGSLRLDIVPFDHHRAAEDPLQLQLRPVARLHGDLFHLVASCDGLLLICGITNYSICNPATRQYAPLPQLDKFTLLGMYPHTPTGEYRLLLLPTPDEPEPARRETCHVFSLGSRQPPRVIGDRWPEAVDKKPIPVPALFRGRLHWHLDHMIMVFDAAAESFRQMRSPVHGGHHGPLFEMDGMIAMYNFTDAAATAIDIWILQDYESEAWAFRCRVELLAEEIKAQFGNLYNYWRMVATASYDGHVMFLVRFGKWLHQVDIHGNLVGSFCRGLLPTQLQLKQTLVPHTFFPKIKRYVLENMLIAQQQIGQHYLYHSYMEVGLVEVHQPCARI